MAATGFEIKEQLRAISRVGAQHQVHDEHTATHFAAEHLDLAAEVVISAESRAVACREVPGDPNLPFPSVHFNSIEPWFYAIPDLMPLCRQIIVGDDARTRQPRFDAFSRFDPQPVRHIGRTHRVGQVKNLI